MKLKQKQQEQMLEAAQPLMRWLKENCHPLCSVEVATDCVALVVISAAVRRTESLIRRKRSGPRPASRG